MALSLILRSAAAKPSAFRSLFGLPTHALRASIAAANTTCMSQLCSQNHQKFVGPVYKSKIVPMLHNVQVRGAHFDHGLLWTTEKILTIGLLVIVPLAVISPSFIMDNVLAVIAVLHNHWGLEAVVIDYVRPVLFGNTIPKICLVILYAVSAIVLAGLISFNMNDIGIGKGLNKLWRIRDKQ